MKTKIKTALLAFTILFGMFSCNKFLDKKENLNQSTPDTIEDLQALLDNLNVFNLRLTPSMGESAADDYYISDANYTSMVTQMQDEYLWMYNGPKSSTDWLSGYNPVYYANLVLESLDKIAITPSNKVLWDNIQGSALFFRSYNFLLLLWDYAKAYDTQTADHDLGIVLRTQSNFNIKSIRANNEASYQKIIQDTKASLLLLPALPQHVMRPSKAAAYGLLARCYLSMRDYKNAGLYADSCLALNNDLMDYNSDAEVNPNSTTPFKQFNKETIFYTEVNQNYNQFLTSQFGRVDTSLYTLYESNDLRKIRYFSYNTDSTIRYIGTYSEGVNSTFSGMATDEMMLISAECKARNGRTEDALSLLNQLLKTRYKTGTYRALTGLSSPDALDTILKERRKELTNRGLRWMDIKRLNKEGRNIILKRFVNGKPYTLQPNANKYALPLPQDIIEITGMPQNPQ